MIPHLPPRRVLFGLVMTVCLDVVVQLLWKHAAVGLPTHAPIQAVIAAALTHPLSYAIAGLFVVQLLNWLRVLEQADLSYVQPITALSYIGVIALSAWLLGEPVTARKGWSIALILGGVWLIGLGPASTRAAEP